MTCVLSHYFLFAWISFDVADTEFNVVGIRLNVAHVQSYVPRNHMKVARFYIVANTDPNVAHIQLEVADTQSYVAYKS
ncbi:hypothetical protein [Psychrobacillus antarcticus]|uniref:hypothetical protein n=1 Tax=Psychrobacillus antarcticus TaxID=2879115 RepID=UPI002407B6CB|nr:hypothetical protein [Psychrobacillus antarcticus]